MADAQADVGSGDDDARADELDLRPVDVAVGTVHIEYVACLGPSAPGSYEKRNPVEEEHFESRILHPVRGGTLSYAKCSGYLLYLKRIRNG